MRRAKEMLADAQNAAIEMDILRGKLAATQKSLANASVHNRALAAEIERLQGENRLILDALGMEKYRVLWRPVTDDGFKSQKAVLIVYKSLIMDVGIIMIARWTPMYEWGGLIDNFVTHWAPLPGLPEEVLE